MFYAYVLRSVPYPNKTYTGWTKDLKQRVADHNCGKSVYTAKEYGPWHLDVYFGFMEETTAIAFEKYLKSGSGRVFSKKHF
jgi:putative endonuclease